ncbi:protein of unknown function DUF1568 [Nitrosococcus halophilus Nc 4]|uniref:Transposase IS200-like domain-containing protein n=1 Tax=Nitrosococcus halophilus (strain Nc4) TaxID=472759 RepID=D5C2D6_NITHN|nr:transposase [Nitrosococcus halophilus]ADE14795.1 protein of unknown function DUF1568 [Nitrosococcus halophilus Nc 4]
MSRYRRTYIEGGCYFFTVVTCRRRPLFAYPETVALLRSAFRKVMTERPFTVDGIVVLPDHLHCLWLLPKGDSDFSSRWREIKKHVSRRFPDSRNLRNEKTIWQRRFWEHAIRDEQDWRRHMDYIHFNPVKHGLASSPPEWPWSSFLKCVEKGWGRDEPLQIANMDLE